MPQYADVNCLTLAKAVIESHVQIIRHLLHQDIICGEHLATHPQWME